MRRLLLCVIAVSLAGPAASAQIFSIYGTFSPTHLSNVQTGSVQTSTGNTNQFTSYWTPAYGGGVTLGLVPIGPVKIGLDLRGSTHPGTVGVDTGLVGLKVGLKVPLISFKPYVQVSGGYLATRTVNVSTGAPAGSTFTNQYAAFEVIGGLDYHFVPFIDIRLIEVGGGKGYNVGISSASNTATLFTVNTGLVLHF